MWRVFYTLLSQQGAKFIEGEEILPGEAGVKALTSMANWVSSGYSPELISYEASIALFTSGKARKRRKTFSSLLAELQEHLGDLNDLAVGGSLAMYLPAVSPKRTGAHSPAAGSATPHRGPRSPRATVLSIALAGPARQ